MHAFDYEKPTDKDGLMAAMRAYGSQPIAGGQTLIPALKQRLAQPAKLVDVTGALSHDITDEGDTLTIGAAARHGDIMSSDVVQARIPALAAQASKIGDPQVRNRGTIGGSLANNDPAACYPSALMALGGSVSTIGPNGGRTISAEDFFDGMFATSLEEGEIIASVSVRCCGSASYQKFEQPASRFALVGVFVAKHDDGVRVAITGAGDDGVFRHAGLESALSGDFSTGAVDGVTVDAANLIGDLHGTPEYRAHIIKVMTKRAVQAIG